MPTMPVNFVDMVSNKSYSQISAKNYTERRKVSPGVAYYLLFLICTWIASVPLLYYERANAAAAAMTDIKSAFTENCIVPDVIQIAPSELIKIQYAGGVSVQMGKELTPTQVKDKPTVTLSAHEDEYYMFAMVDPDAPSREDPKFREWQHWLIGNIFGGDMAKGEVLSDYIGAGPPKGTGLHRYVFIVYKQPGKLDFSKVKKLRNNSSDHRGKFSISKFATEHKLGSPIAGNFFVAKYDDYVPKLYATLKG